MRLRTDHVSLRDGEAYLPTKIDLLIADAKHPFAVSGQAILVVSWTEGDGRPLEPHLLPQTHHDDLCRLILTFGLLEVPEVNISRHRSS